MKTLFTSITAALCTALSVGAAKPNIILILADDLGYSDIGCYGGEIQTPNIDRLAANGIRFTQFFNSAKCEPTRASLMSGQYWQTCGLGVKKGPTMGEAMRLAGYTTLALGKWHLAGNPFDRGFDHYFGHLSGGSDYFTGNPSHRLDDKPFKPKADGTFYTTDANADYAIRFLDETHQQHPEKPFFMYLAFNAPHAPLQAWPEDIAKYRGKYLSGWDKLRAQRYRRQLDMGIMKQEWTLSPRPDTIPAWDTLTDEEKTFEDVRMAVYAAQVDRMDQAIGRVLAKVKALGQEENTLVIFLCDNGASPFDHGKVEDRRIEPLLDGTGHLGYGLGWANLSVTPFRHYKRNMFNGGSVTACVAYWPSVIKQHGALTDQRAHIIDLMATFVDVGDGQWPSEFKGEPNPPLPGKSLLPILAGGRRAPPDPLYFQLFDHRAVISGDWKLVSDWNRPWELFNLKNDRTEMRNLKAAEPERAAMLEKLWEDWAATSVTRFHDAGAEPIYRHLSDAAEKFMTGDVENSGNVKKSKAESRKSAVKKDATGGIRARVGTGLKIEGDELVLTCTGDDPGLAFNRITARKGPCPWTLTFSLSSRAAGAGEIFSIADAKTSLPKGQHQAFDVIHDGKWHSYSITLDNKEALYGFRFDPCAGDGEVRIKGLALKDAAGQVLCSWPETVER